MKCQITETGYLQIPSEIAQRYFATGAVIAILDEHDLLIMPVNYVGAGGLILKYRNAKGDRSVLVSELLPDDVDYGPRTVEWDENALALRIPLYVK
ncbi:hydrogenase maturation protease [Ureibacillus sp. FSL K6-8385]|uniref:Hydrogenase maturation protease n=1 Tax=Ureibacillus terrenus TaxID=118246 RepID=A0A540UWX4_9BACL|nr:hydrogenase maturation protease [Ureibacillus terrenus]MED3661751.1 hydrogenase maturation protease [Ureibacillus terrenus]MED3763467.1 hydrogenase maturation protease [Ureibacillus terrenus]TQE88988.1 hydrogenase maturation protease [Ureibacillus terrenus]